MAYRGLGDDIQAADYGNAVLGSHMERLTGRSTCQKSAVLVTFVIEFCVTNISAARQVFIDGYVTDIQ
jgi:hypothetical protein